VLTRWRRPQARSSRPAALPAVAADTPPPVKQPSVLMETATPSGEADVSSGDAVSGTTRPVTIKRAGSSVALNAAGAEVCDNRVLLHL
jgi:hypothetical protein